MEETNDAKMIKLRKDQFIHESMQETGQGDDARESQEEDIAQVGDKKKQQQTVEEGTSRMKMKRKAMKPMITQIQSLNDDDLEKIGDQVKEKIEEVLAKVVQRQHIYIITSDQLEKLQLLLEYSKFVHGTTDKDITNIGAKHN